MARFDLYANPIAAERKHTPYVLDVQNDHLAVIASRVVIPLRTLSSVGAPVRDLNPELSIGGRRLLLDTANIAAVDGGLLRKPVQQLREERSLVLDALDTLFGSY
jgi:toxin CcdB